MSAWYADGHKRIWPVRFGNATRVTIAAAREGGGVTGDHPPFVSKPRPHAAPRDPFVPQPHPVPGTAWAAVILIVLAVVVVGMAGRPGFLEPYRALSPKRLTVRLSYDECRSWSPGKVLYDGPSAYSDLCIASDRSICCLYERGKERPYEGITFARFSLEWLTDGADGIKV